MCVRVNWSGRLASTKIDRDIRYCTVHSAHSCTPVPDISHPSWLCFFRDNQETRTHRSSYAHIKTRQIRYVFAGFRVWYSYACISIQKRIATLHRKHWHKLDMFDCLFAPLYSAAGAGRPECAYWFNVLKSPALSVIISPNVLCQYKHCEFVSDAFHVTGLVRASDNFIAVIIVWAVYALCTCVHTCRFYFELSIPPHHPHHLFSSSYEMSMRESECVSSIISFSR